MNWKWDYEGFGALLCGPEMEALMGQKIARAEDAAKAIAPVDDGTPGGHYRDKFQTETGVAEMGGGRRAYGRLTNTSPHAAAVEWGNRRAPAQHVLLRSIDHMQE